MIYIFLTIFTYYLDGRNSIAERLEHGERVNRNLGVIYWTVRGRDFINFIIDITFVACTQTRTNITHTRL